MNIAVPDFFNTQHCITTKKKEQRKIADFLNLINERIETQKKVIEDFKKLKETFEEMKQQKAEGDTIEVCTKEEVSSSMKAALKGFSMKASIADSCYERIDQRIEKMDASLKRPPLMKVNMNLSTKILVIIIMVLLTAGVAGYFWFVNTPMYLSHQLYQSHRDIYGGAPGSKYDWAYRNILAGHRDKIKSLIKTNKNQKGRLSCLHRQPKANTLKQQYPYSRYFIRGLREDYRFHRQHKYLQVCAL